MQTARQKYEFYKDLFEPAVLAQMTDKEKLQAKAAFDSIAYQLCKEEYKFYVEFVHKGLWKPSNFHVWLCDKIQEFIEKPTKKAYEILLLSVPPQHGKSTTVTETLPSWYLGHRPMAKVILVSYNQTKAEEFGRKNKSKMIEFLPTIFNVEANKRKRLDRYIEMDNGVGSLRACGVDGGITGNGANLLIVDDPIKGREEADSLLQREKVWDVWTGAVRTRLGANAKIIVIQTRWHEDDLYGRVLAAEKNITVINIPCEAEENDLLGRSIGEPLCPEIDLGDGGRKDAVWLDEMKQAYLNDPNKGGARAWYALFQGRPNIQEGNLIKEIYWNYWKPKGMKLPPVVLKTADGSIITKEAIEIPDYLDELIQSWDLTFDDTKNSDFVCGGTWGRRISNLFLLDLVNERMDIIKQMDAIRKMTKKYPGATIKLIEKKANGAAVIKMLQGEIQGIVPVDPQGSKEVRVNSWLHIAEGGNVYLPHPAIAKWVNDFIQQCKSFPNSTHDDMVDMSSQAINRLKNSTRSTDVLSTPDGYRTEKELEDMGYKKPLSEYRPMKRDSRHLNSSRRKAKVI